ncbi:MAG: hypothetical protein JST00_06265 [Deltaproteobacteria bacterium]|nr:hypothetical protein [Deltaproteobacteria bacterium]
MKTSSTAATWITLLAAASAFSVEACRREGVPSKPAAVVPVAPASAPATSDAGPVAVTAATPPAAPSDPTLRIVAEGDMNGTSPSVTDDGRLVVASGAFVYHARPDGELALQGTPGAYAPLFPGSEETVIGYVSHARPVRVLGAGKGFDVKLSGDEGAAFHVDDGSMTMLDGKAFAKDAAPAEVQVEGANGKCFPLLSFDGKTYARCQVRASKARKVTFHVKDAAGAWRSAFVSASDVDDNGTVGADGALYASVHGAEKIVRCEDREAAADAGEGPCEALPMDTKAEGTASPGYQTSYTDAMNPEESRYWATIRVTNPPALKGPLAIERVVARSSADVWAVATAPAVGSRVFLHAHPAGPRTRLPSDVDGRVLARNTKAPAPWVGHCDQVFVKVAAAKLETDGKPSAGGVKADALAARAAEIKKMLAVKTESEAFTPYGAAIVEGRLHDEQVAGVIVFRSDVEGSVDRMERIVDKMIDKLAANPMSRPQAYCTLPVLTSVVAE